jgi:hypothetical protein
VIALAAFRDFMLVNGVGQNLTASLIVGAFAVLPLRRAWTRWHDRHQLTLAAHHERISAELGVLERKIERLRDEREAS